jgi:hypothetical protein
MCAWPRFEYYHLALVLLGLFFVKSKLSYKELVVIAFSLGVMFFVKVTPLRRDNFYGSTLTMTLTAMIDEYDRQHVYLFGGPDQAYVTSSSIPAGYYYLPSLSWYHKEQLIKTASLME